MSLGDTPVRCDDCHKKAAVRSTWIVGQHKNGSPHVVCEDCSKKYSTRRKQP